MFSQRWSTFTLLALVLLTALSAFYGGQLSKASHSISATVPLMITSGKPSPAISSPPTVIASTEPQPKTELEARCRELLGQPGTPAGEQALAELIEKMAEQDPQRAIALAAAQNNLRLRAAL